MTCQSGCRETKNSYKTEQAEAQTPLDQLVSNDLLKGNWAEECYSLPSPDLIVFRQFKRVTL